MQSKLLLRSSFVLSLIAGATASVPALAGAAHSRHHRSPSDFASGSPGESAHVGRVIQIEAEDMAFDKANIRVVADETIRFVVTNTGDLMHDFTIGTVDAQAAHRREMAEATDDRHAHDHQATANAIVLKPGETKELTWRFARADNIEFACNVPGHYEAGMRGEIEVVTPSSSPQA